MYSVKMQKQRVWAAVNEIATSLRSSIRLEVSEFVKIIIKISGTE